MQEAKIYRQYAADCTRMAQKLTAQDKAVLLKIADAWEQRAREAELQEKKKERQEMIAPWSFALRLEEIIRPECSASVP